jgi:hypothetical protein
MIGALLQLAPALGRIPWRLVGGVAAAVLAAYLGGRIVREISAVGADRAALQEARRDLAELAQRLEDAEAVGKADAAAAVHFAGRAAELERQADQLRAAVFAAVRAGDLVTDREDPNDATRRAAVLSPRFRLCFNAAAGGDPAAAASCEAGGGDAADRSAVSAAGLVRSGGAP